MSLCCVALAGNYPVMDGWFLDFASCPVVDHVVDVSWSLFGVSGGQPLHLLQLLQT